MLGLLDKDPKKYGKFEAEIRKLASQDELSRRYYEEWQQVNEWYEKEFKPMYREYKRRKGGKER